MQDTVTDRLPLDWDEWQNEWKRWKAAHVEDLREYHGQRIHGKNFLADDVLGTWKINGRVVELSEVTFPNLSERDAQTGRLIDRRDRMIGITYKNGDESESGGVVSSFAELESALEI